MTTGDKSPSSPNVSRFGADIDAPPAHKDLGYAVTPWRVLQAAIKAVPAVKYALGVLGIISAIAIVRAFGIDARLAVFGTIVMLVLMVTLLVFAALTKVKSKQIRVAAIIMMWSFLALTIFTATLLFTSAFFRYPKPLPELFGPASAADRKEFDRLLDQAWDALGGAPNTHVLTNFSTPNIEEARRALRDARNLRPRDPNICVVEAAVSFAMGSPEFAEETLRKGLRLAPDDWDLQYNLGWILACQQKYDEAFAAYECAAKLDLKSPHPQYGMAMVRKAQGRLDEAVSSFHSCLALDPTDAQAHFYLADTLVDLNDTANATQEYSLAVRWSPANAKYRFELGVRYIAQEQPDLARAEFEEVNRLEPNSFPGAYINLGSILAMEGKPYEAELALRNAVRLDPTSATAFSNLGNALFAQGKFQDAVAAHRQAVAIDPQGEGRYWNLANALRKAGKTDDAITAYRRTISLDPDRAVARRDLGVLLFEQGHREESLRELGEAVKALPNDAYARNCLGVVLAEAKDFGGAIREFREALRLRPGFQEAQSNLDMARHSQHP